MILLQSVWCAWLVSGLLGTSKQSTLCPWPGAWAALQGTVLLHWWEAWSLTTRPGSAPVARTVQHGVVVPANEASFCPWGPHLRLFPSLGCSSLKQSAQQQNR